MPTIKYIGTADNYSELAATGKQSVWQVGQHEYRSTSEAVALLATGMFSSIANTAVMADVNPATGLGIQSIWNGSQAQYDAISVKDGATLYVIV